MLDTFIKKVTGDPNVRELKRLDPIVRQINALEPGLGTPLEQLKKDVRKKRG